MANPRKGDVEDGTGGVRKVRAAIGGGGKTGGARVLYMYAEERSKIYLLLAFRKNVQPALTAAQKKALRELSARLKMEAR